MRSKLLLVGGIPAALCLTACLNHPLKPVEYDKAQEQANQIELTVNKDVDILFVIDNSGSMGEEQAKLAQNFGAFVDVLERPDVKANYRLGVTTTDNSNPWCGGTSPEAGKLVFENCTDRPSEFESLDGQTDVYDLACTDVCDFAGSDVTHLETGVDKEGEGLEQRPWLENIEGATNVELPGFGPGEGMAEAFACYGPQGIHGCGFESHLESMYKTLTRTAAGEDDAFGFIRDQAILAIVHVTDEADCSYVNDYKSIFETDGNRVFWSDPDSAFPTSAVCWNAGVECQGDPSNYSSCDATNKDVDGNLDVDDGDAVLHPMSRYLNQLQGFEDQKKDLNANNEVIVGLIGGVASDGSVSYNSVEQQDPTFQEDFGIGWGCSSDGGAQKAIPPVRLRDFTENFTDDNMHSICDDSYEGALETIADIIAAQLQPACYAECAKDTDPNTPDVVEPECIVEQIAPGGVETTIEECEIDGNGYVFVDGAYQMPADDVNVCFAVLGDQGGATSDPNDDISPDCTDLGYNLEFKLERRAGFPAAGGTTVNATCALSEFKQVDCPDLQ